MFTGKRTFNDWNHSPKQLTATTTQVNRWPLSSGFFVRVDKIKGEDKWNDEIVEGKKTKSTATDQKLEDCGPVLTDWSD